MKKVIILLVSLYLVTGLGLIYLGTQVLNGIRVKNSIGSVPGGNRVQVGEVLPRYQLSDLKDKPVMLEPDKDKLILIVFVATWSPQSLDQLELFSDLDQSGVHLKTIFLGDDPVAAANLLEAYSLPDSDVLIDKDLAVSRHFSVISPPSSVLVDGKGKILEIFHGFVHLDQLEPYLQKS